MHRHALSRCCQCCGVLTSERGQQPLRKRPHSQPGLHNCQAVNIPERHAVVLHCKRPHRRQLTTLGQLERTKNLAPHP
jgi:hypothetical protein